ncbi:MAG: type II secretion system protein [Vicinamibacterales bacterium]
MHLGGQAGQRGYAMAALLVSVSIMAILMTALLPVWKQQARREKEAELAFRGEQWARAVYLFNTKNGGQYPPSLDALVQGRYVRKKYKDPMTVDGEWQPIFLGQQPQQPQQPGQPQGRGTGPGAAGGRGGVVPPAQNPGGFGAGQGSAGIATVQSKSKDASIRIYNGAGYYNQWQFRYNGRGRGQGTGSPQQGNPQRGGPGGPGTGPGGRGPGVGQPGTSQPGIGQQGGGRGSQGRGRGF